MTKAFGGILLFLVSWLASAETFSIGGRSLEIPPPNGFVVVTPAMDAMYRWIMQLTYPENELLAYYIPETEVPVAMRGDLVTTSRYCLLEVNRQAKNTTVSQKDFAGIRRAIRSQYTEISASSKRKVKEPMEKASENLSQEFGIDFSTRVSRDTPLAPHYETENVIASSSYTSYHDSIGGKIEERIISGTNAVINLEGKVLFLYCVGAAADLDWTRSASKEWIEMITAANGNPLRGSSKRHAIDWGQVTNQVIYGTVAGVFMIIVGVLIARFKKKG